MTNVIKWPKHVLYACPPGCDRPECPFCRGGLAFCTVCKGAEASLPTDCPGEKMGAKLEDDVQEGRANYLRQYGWVTPGARSWKPNTAPNPNKPRH